MAQKGREKKLQLSILTIFKHMLGKVPIKGTSLSISGLFVIFLPATPHVHADRPKLIWKNLTIASYIRVTFRVPVWNFALLRQRLKDANVNNILLPQLSTKSWICSSRGLFQSKEVLSYTAEEPWPFHPFKLTTIHSAMFSYSSGLKMAFFNLAKGPSASTSRHRMKTSQ